MRHGTSRDPRDGVLTGVSRELSRSCVDYLSDSVRQHAMWGSVWWDLHSNGTAPPQHACSIEPTFGSEAIA
jgi:hypothetical protein